MPGSPTPEDDDVASLLRRRFYAADSSETSTRAVRRPTICDAIARGGETALFGRRLDGARPGGSVYLNVAAAWKSTAERRSSRKSES